MEPTIIPGLNVDQATVIVALLPLLFVYVWVGLLRRDL